MSVGAALFLRNPPKRYTSLMTIGRCPLSTLSMILTNLE